MSSYKRLKTVEKTLDVVRILNAEPFSRIKTLAQKTGIPKPTLVRILETLVALGYVKKVDRLSGYCITDKVLALSAGYHGLPSVLTGIQARADRITAEFQWPASIATLDGDAMIVRYSTIPQSPLAHIHSTINRRLSLMRRAHGRAYLAFCPKAEQTHLLKVLAKDEDLSAADLVGIKQELTQICANKFARRAPVLQGQTSTLAVPVWVENRLVATLGVTYFKNAVPDPIHLVNALMADD